MFNALNRFISRLDSDSPTHQNRDNHSAFGFQVLRNKTSELAVEPWFDFIVGINGRMIDDSDANLFAQEGQRTRTIHIPVPSDTPSLGLTLQWTSLSTVSNIWHILDRLYPRYPEGVLHGESGLGELVEDHIGRPLRLYIYNNEYNVTREVTIHPSRDWGGDGALGCTLGYGALHRLPAPLSEPVAGPGETLFEGESARFSNEEPRENMGSESNASQLFMPAAVSQEPARKKEKKHGHNPNNFMDDYFMEGEKKSRELDHAPSTKSGGVPPPPKAGGPPRSGTPKAASPAPSPIPTETKDPYDSGVD
ncbi:GRASP55/65 family protein [Botrytis cinerea]